MLLIPVLDLRGGQVVRAVRGERGRYQPVRSRLVAGSEPCAVARALLGASGSDTLYVADIDALLGAPPQTAVIAALLDALPATTLWLDAGFADAASARALLAALGPQVATTPITPVFGSESLRSLDALDDAAGVILSLDRHRGRALDAAGLWGEPSRWPERVIAMALDAVGAAAGPELALFAQLRARAPQRHWIGAGGIRDDADLDACAKAGAHGWLVASALHDARLAQRGAAVDAAGTRLASEAAT